MEKQLAMAAVSESRIITEEEAAVRKRVGIVIGLITIVVVAAWPAFRSYYGAISFLIGSAIGTWRTGNQHL